MPHDVHLSDPIFGRLQRLAVPLVDSIESVIVKLADYWDQGHADPKPNGNDTPTPPEDIDGTDQLPTKAFRVPLVEAMYQLGGSSEVKHIRELMRNRLNPLLGPGDRRIFPSNHSERWWNATEWNRLKLVKEGLFKNESKEGTWELSEDGVRYAESLIASRKPDISDQQGTKPRTFNVKSVPKLTHTKLLSAKVGKENIRPAWNGLLLHLIRRIPKGTKADELRRLIIINFVPGKKEDEGYQFVPELGISVQGQDADGAWKGSAHLAQKLGVPVEVEFLWRMKEGAAFPGVTGRISVSR